MLAEAGVSPLDRLARQFASPPKDFSPAPIWWWSGDRLDRRRLRWQMEQLVAGGVYNVVVLNLAPTGPLYGSDADRPAFLSDEWWAIFLGVCADAETLGMRLWVYDQLGFSGANLQGELVRQAPAFAGQSLETLTVEGAGVLEAACPSEGELLAATYTLLDEQGQSMGEPMEAKLDGPGARVAAPGRKRLRLVYAVRRGFDYFNPAACQQLLNMVHGAFERKAGRYFGQVIVGSFQDELPSMPTWSAGFCEEFRHRRDYDLRPYLAYLCEGEGQTAEQVRVDYHQVRAELAEQAFFRPLFEWHESHGLICGFDQQGPSRAGQPVGSVQQYANYLATHRWYAAPGSDHHGHAKIHSSLAHLYQRPRVWIESFHSSGWGGTLEETFDWLLPWLRAGATLYNPHAVYYSTRGGWWEWAPPSTCWRQPYWQHYSLFARAVSRLCYLLSRGTHVCDIAILYPTTTIQSSLTVEGPLPRAQTANAVYEALVGSMMFLNAVPGILDQDRRDFDIIDDLSVQRAALRDRRLCVSDEQYGIIILPACAVLPAATADQLVRFVGAGGTLIAIGVLPQQLAGTGAHSLDALSALFSTGKAVFLERPEALPEALKPQPRRVDAPVPILHRRVEGTEVVFVPAAFPHASFNSEPPSPAWHKVEYRFEPERYQRPMTIRARGFKGEPELWDVLSGERRALATRAAGDVLEIDLPFDTAPAALLVWPEAGTTVSGVEATPGEVCHEFTEPWECTLEPTLDNRFGDFDKPDAPGAPPVQTWRVGHRVELPGEDGLRDGWQAGNMPTAGMNEAQATFGQYGWWIGPCSAHELPAPLGGPLEPGTPWSRDWRPAVYSLQRGIHQDALHENNLGPKAHVPEEFLPFGTLQNGQGVQFRTAIWMPESTRLHLALGAAARKIAWLNGQALGEGTPGYLWIVPVELRAGMNLLEWRLEAETHGELRAYWALVQTPAAFARPERITPAGGAHKDSRLQFCCDFDIPFAPVECTLQVATDALARLLVNGIEAGRQGGFDPYASLARVQPYAVLNARQGTNTIVLEVHDTGSPISVLIDGLARGPIGEAASLVSGSSWQVRRDDGPLEPVALEPRQWLDPAWSHLWRRPHPLPGATWIEDAPADDTVLAVVPDALFGQSRVEWFQWRLPPGVAAMHLPVAGQARVWVDGIELDTNHTLIHVPAAKTTQRKAVLRVSPERGRTGGGVLAGPITYEIDVGRIETGDWGLQGLEAYSGGVRYRASFALPAAARGRVVLDLGRVRGTAEVWVNGQPAGVRIWSPYRFDVTPALTDGQNQLEILVLNTLAPYLGAVSPTHYVRPGQVVSGMLGPVRVYAQTSERDP